MFLFFLLLLKDRWVWGEGEKMCAPSLGGGGEGEAKKGCRENETNERKSSLKQVRGKTTRGGK